MNHASELQLTEQQQSIVNHNHGPGLVFAVAGAGKTTAMVQRIERLVRERVFRPEQILATSFNKAANDEIQNALHRWPACAAVQVKTLHALGFQIIRQAAKGGYLPALQPEKLKDNVAGLDRQLLYATLARARQERVRYLGELNNFDHDDFLTYVGACKGNLHYANLAQAALPPTARKIAKQATAPPGLTWYRDLYRLFEEVRQAQGLITFDDMLLIGWEMLVKHADLLGLLRRQIQCVLVDEFQDINLAQAEMLDLLTAPQRNYMAIGDDDQTIYEWRGANPRFILDFEKRYAAQVYFMTDNFRCKAAHVALANRVIQHNRLRRPKQMRLTQGFDGDAQLHKVASPEAMAQHIVQTIGHHLRDGYPPSAAAILVRIYAQTPPIEQALITAQIPYQIVGSEPFYQRAEVLTLLDYCRLGQIEAALQAETALTAEQVIQFNGAWGNVYNRPTRYVSRAVADAVAERVVFNHLPLGRALLNASHTAPPRMAEPLQKLAGDIQWLATALTARRAGERAASQILHKLEERLGYAAHLKASSGFPETGAAKAANVAAFLAYARNKGTVEQLMQHLATLAAARQGESSDQPAVMITSLFRAKGLEWPLVFVPNCNQGTLPYERSTHPEEERRLLYVAITRTQKFLYLYALQHQPLSQFLDEANCEQTLATVGAIGRALTREPAAWRSEEMLGMAVDARRLHLDGYFRQWWDAPAAHKQRLAGAVMRILTTIEQRGWSRSLGVSPADMAAWQTISHSSVSS
ncbi:MAG: ATP-dependent helicase [Chloroflexota bacterium]|nr:ATP-dependent helicase [Chloroflexota bacterium]